MIAVPTEKAKTSATARLGQRLRDARLAHNMTQSDVAQGEFSVSYISAVERGQLRPSLPALERLAQRLQVPVPDLLREGDGPVAPGALTRPPAEATGPRNEAEQRLWRARILAHQGKSAEALDILSRLRHQVAMLGPGELGHWHWSFASTYLLLGQAEEARNEIQEAIPLAEETGDTRLRAWLRYGLGKAGELERQWPAALEAYQECLSALTRKAVVDPALSLNALSSLGGVCLQLGEDELALDYLNQAIQIVPDLLDAERLASTYWTIASAYADQGNARQACQYAIRSVAAYEQGDAQRLATRVYSRLGHVYVQANRLDEARASLETARAMAERGDNKPALVEVFCGLAAVYLGWERLDDAAMAINWARAAADALDDPAQEAEVLLVEARLLEAQGEAEAACQDFEQAVGLLEQSAATHGLSLALKAYSDFAERQGDSTRALELLKRAWQLHVGASSIPQQHSSGARI